MFTVYQSIVKHQLLFHGFKTHPLNESVLFTTTHKTLENSLIVKILLKPNDIAFELQANKKHPSKTHILVRVDKIKNPVLPKITQSADAKYLGTNAYYDVNLLDNAYIVSDAVQRYINVRNGGHILELGSGNGRLMRLIKTCQDIMHMQGASNYNAYDNIMRNYTVIEKQQRYASIIQKEHPMAKMMIGDITSQALPEELGQLDACVSLNFADLFLGASHTYLQKIHSVMHKDAIYLDIQEYDHPDTLILYILARNPGAIPCSLFGYKGKDIQLLYNKNMNSNQHVTLMLALAEHHGIPISGDNYLTRNLQNIDNIYMNYFKANSLDIRSREVDDRKIEKIINILNNYAKRGLISQKTVKPHFTLYRYLETCISDSILSLYRLAKHDKRLLQTMPCHSEIQNSSCLSKPQHRYFKVMKMTPIITKNKYGFTSDSLGAWHYLPYESMHITKGLMVLKKVVFNSPQELLSTLLTPIVRRYKRRQALRLHVVRIQRAVRAKLLDSNKKDMLVSRPLEQVTHKVVRDIKYQQKH